MVYIYKIIYFNSSALKCTSIFLSVSAFTVRTRFAVIKKCTLFLPCLSLIDKDFYLKKIYGIRNRMNSPVKLYLLAFTYELAASLIHSRWLIGVSLGMVSAPRTTPIVPTSSNKRIVSSSISFCVPV